MTETTHADAAHPEFVLTLSCPDRVGIVHAVSGLLADGAWNIVESQQFGDGETGRFFMRVQARGQAGCTPASQMRTAFSELGDRLSMQWGWHDRAFRPAVLVLVSRFGHCLNDLLYRWRIGALPIDLVGVASNHPDFAQLVASYGVPFHHLPVTAATKPQQEGALLDLVGAHGVDLVVLARYMQILSKDLVGELYGRAINIHHGLLPSFKGAQPYRQAYERGVKIVGATAHYVSEHLDEGPIIEQVVEPVNHSMSPDDLAAVGRDLECVALSRAVSWHVEHRVFLNGPRTVVFR
jgi:formyltetrahydrofolate deformylase